MEAADVVEILKKKLAVVSGGRDFYGRPIITVAPQVDFNLEEITKTLDYFSSIYGAKRIYFIVIIDLKKSSGRKLAIILKAVQTILIGKLNKVIVIKNDAFKFNLQFDFKKESDVLECEIMFIKIHKLHQVISPSQLTKDLNGNLDFDFEHWLQNRLLLEEFIKQTKTASRHLNTTFLRLQNNLSLMTKTNAKEMLEENKCDYLLAKKISNEILEKGDSLVSRLCTDEDSGFVRDVEISSNKDTKDAIEQVLQHYTSLEDQIKDFDAFWLNMENSLIQMLEFNQLEKDIQSVVDWFLGPGENLMSTQHDIGSSFLSAEELRKKHEKIELTFTGIYGVYAKLRHKTDEMIKSNHPASTYVEAQRGYMNAVCRSFAHRLERRRNLLIMSSLFHRLVQNLFEKFCNLMEVLQEEWKLEDNDQCERLLRLIYNLQLEIDEETQEACHESERLLDLIALPVKNANGNDVTPNYTNAIMHIKRIGAQLEERKKQVDEGVELRRLRLEQITKMIACETEADQLIDCLSDMLAELMRCYFIGASPSQTKSLESQHDCFQNKAQQTYELCRQLLHVALTLRRSSKLSLDLNTKLGCKLHKIWRQFLTESNKRTTLLSNCKEFYINIDRLLEEFDKNVNSAVLGRLSEVCRHLCQLVYTGHVLLKEINFPKVFRSEQISRDDEAAQQIQQRIDEAERRLDEFRDGRRGSDPSLTTSTSSTAKMESFITAKSSTIADEFKSLTSDDWRTAASAATSADELDEFYSADENGLESSQRELKEMKLDSGEGVNHSGIKVIRAVSSVKQVSHTSISHTWGSKPSVKASRQLVAEKSLQSGSEIVTHRKISSSTTTSLDEELNSSVGPLISHESFPTEDAESKLENDELLRHLKEVGEQMCDMIDTIVAK